MAISTNGTVLTRLAGALYNTQMSNATYKEVAALDPSALANALYARDFSSTTDSTVATTLVTNLGLSTVEGLANWVAAQLTAAGANKGAKVVELLNGFAQMSADATYGAAATAFNTKVNAALALSQTTDDVGGAFDSISAAVSGKTFALTDSLDVRSGTAGNDAFVGNASTLNAGDDIKGGDGTDTLIVNTAAAATLGGFTAGGIEKVQVGAAGGAATVAMDGVSGETTVASTGSSQNVTFSGLDTLVAAEVVSTSAGTLTLAYNTSVVTGTADVQSVTLNNATSSLDIAGVETINIAASGTNTVAAITATSARSITVTGSGTSTTLTDIPDTVKSVDASTYAGKITVGGIGGVDVSIVGGSANDTFNFTGGNPDSGDTVNGGAGNDTLVIGSSGLTSSTALKYFTSVEDGRIEYAADLTNAEISASLFSGLITVKVADSLASDNDPVAITVSSAGSTQSLAITDSTNAADVDDAVDGVSVAVTQKTGVGTTADVLTVTISGEDLLSLTADQYETLNLATGGVAGSQIDSVSATTAQKIVVTGSQDLNITSLDMEEQSTTLGYVSEFDASAFTGKLTVTFANDEGKQKIVSGSGSDTITMTAIDADDTIDGGSGVDTLTVTNINGDLGEPSLSNIEVFVLESDGATTTTAIEIDVRNLTTLTSLVLDMNDGTTGDVDVDTTINNIPAGVAVTIQDDSDGTNGVILDTASGNNTLSVTFEDEASGADYDAPLNANVDNLTIKTANSSSDIIITTLTGATIDNLTLSGSGDITITTASSLTSLDVLDATGVSGAVTLTTLARASAANITLGSGSDSLNFVTSSHGANVIKAGGGTDTLVLSGGMTSAMVIDLSSVTDQISTLNGAANTAIQTGFENINGSALTGAGINVTGATAGSTITGTAQADSITAGLGAVVVRGNSGSDIIDLTASTSADTLEFTEASSSYSDTITGFVKGRDILKFVDASGALTLAGTATEVVAAGTASAITASTVTANVLVITDALTQTAATISSAVKLADAGTAVVSDGAIIISAASTGDVNIWWDGDADDGGAVTASTLIATLVGVSLADLSSITATYIDFLSA